MKRALATLLTAGLLPTVAGCGGSPQQAAAKAYLAAWSRGDVNAAATRTTDATRAAAAITGFRDTLHVQSVTASLGRVTSAGATGTAEFTAQVRLRDVGVWRYTGHLDLQRAGGHWLVRWSTTDLHPGYADGTALSLRRTLPARGDLLDLHGQPLFTQQPVVHVGIEPARAGAHTAETVRAVARAVGVDAGSLAKAVAAAAPHAFVPVITLRRDAYDRVKPRIYSLPGTVFNAGTQLLPPSTGFGRAVLGSVGADGVGIGGLQGALDRRLAGRATTSVVVTDRTTSATATLISFAGSPGADVRTTLDVAAQRAAETALSHLSKPAAFAVVRISDGAVLAAANSPSTSSFDRALVGHYPPGSTFKVVTTYAALGAGITASTPIACPATVTVGGRTFRNFEGEASAGAVFGRDFAVSCNTAFIDVSRRLDDGALGEAARALGVGAEWHLPVDTFSGAVPPPHDVVDKAAEAIGQGRVSVSPLTMALVAAAVAGGRPHAPVLVTEPPQPPSAAAGPLDGARLTTLRSLMRLVVTSGTAAGAHLPAGTFGKTGTAEFGTANPPQTHAWFVGFRKGIAFALVVEGGGVGGRVAAPIAADFLRRYRG